jgi:hypothetical protein
MTTPQHSPDWLAGFESALLCTRAMTRFRLDELKASKPVHAGLSELEAQLAKQLAIVAATKLLEYLEQSHWLAFYDQVISETEK